MTSAKNILKAQRERLICEQFLRARGLWSQGCVLQSRDPPEPDVLLHSSASAAIAFELVEILDNDYARTSGSDRAIKNQLNSTFAGLPEPTISLNASEVLPSPSSLISWQASQRPSRVL